MARAAVSLAIGSILLLAAAIFVAGAGSYFLNRSIDVAATTNVYRITIVRGRLTVSNAPQVEIKAAIDRQLEAGRSRAYDRMFIAVDRMNEQPVRGTKQYVERTPRAILGQELGDAADAVRGLTQMQPVMIARSTPSSYSCRGRTAVAIGMIPYLTMVLTGVALRRRRAARQSQSGLCRACGYDLRASKERCPECGTPVPARAI